MITVDTRQKAVGSWMMIVALMAWEYAQWTYFDPSRFNMLERPYVYRALVPWLASGLTRLGMDLRQAFTLLMVASAVGLYLGILYLPGRAGRNEFLRSMLAALGVAGFLFLFLKERKVYDLGTAMWFALALGLLARRKMDHYFAAFTFASVNRETTFLLMLVFMAYFFGKMGWKEYAISVGYQGYLFAAVRVCLVMIFASYPGVDMLVRPLENLQAYMSVAGLVQAALFGVVLWWCMRNLPRVPRILQVAFLVMMPTLIVLYIVLGWPYEIRVFAEIWPVVWIIVWNNR
jgi:hypothetical protein